MDLLEAVRAAPTHRPFVFVEVGSRDAGWGMRALAAARRFRLRTHLVLAEPGDQLIIT